MKRGLAITAIIAGLSGCQMALPEEGSMGNLYSAAETKASSDIEKLLQLIEMESPAPQAPELMQEDYFRICRDGEYDYDTRCIDYSQDAINRIDQSVYKMHIKHAYVDSAGNQWQAKGACSATLLEGGLVLTAGHCASLGKLEAMGIEYETEFALVRNGKSYEIEILMTGEKDFAILKLKKEADLPYFPYALGDTSNIKTGNYTLLFGCLDDPYSHTRSGIVSKVEPGAEIGADIDSYFGSGYFLIENGISHGDSGGPVIGFRDGVPELIGINIYTHVLHERAGGVLRLDRILKEIRQRANRSP